MGSGRGQEEPGMIMQVTGKAPEENTINMLIVHIPV